MKKHILSLLCLLLFTSVYAQNKYSKQFEEIKKSYDQEKLLELFSQFTEKEKLQKESVKRYSLLNNIPIRFEDEFGVLKEIQFISEEGLPIYFTTFNSDAAISTRANYLNTGGGLGLDLNGNGLTAHVWDGGLARSTHQEYDGAGGNNRFSIGDGTSALHFHSAHVTGTIIASGVQAAAKGMAWQATAVGYDWNSDTAEATTAAGNGMLVSNHSYGYDSSSLPDDQFGQYGSDASAWDQIMYNAPYYLMVVAAGNDGDDDISNAAPLDGNSFYDKLSGHATAKNNLVVANGQDASIDANGNLISVAINSSSSEGPTDDYRIKPDITGNGTALYSTYESTDTEYASISGTSMASPNVTGTLLLLQEYYNNLNGNFMRAATLKGLALHTADDAGPNGPDVVYGWGLLNAKKAAETLTTAFAGSGSAIVDEITLNQGQTYQITVQSNGVDPLLASISWTDPAGAVNSGTNSGTPALVNDLDIRLDNGSSFTPWRLTGVATNGTGDNNVDPYERIDVSGASGIYTLTVTHKGTLSSGSQNFSLIVTGVVVATTPVISFATATGNTTEDTDCSFTDIDVTLNIAQAPSANTDVTFSVNGSSTATANLDFEIVTPSVTFLAGQTNPQNMTLRVYHDGFVEVDETVVIDFTVNANGGDATGDANADAFTLTIIDDDTAPLPTQVSSLYLEDFDDGVFDVTTSGNTGSDFWSAGNTAAATSTYWSTTGNASTFAFTNDDSCNCDKANDLLTTTVFSMVGPYISATLTFDHAFANVGGEIGDVLISTGGVFTSVLALSNTSVDQGGSVYQTPWVNGITVDMTPYIGQATVRVQFRYNDGGNWAYGMAVDNISITAVSATNVQTAINDGSTNDSQDLATSGTIYTSDSSTGNVMLDITNNQADDYECVAISVSRAGNGAQSYNGSVSPDLVMDKTFKLTPTNTIGSGDTSITFYFTEVEIAGWEAATGTNRNTLIIGREVGGTITEVSATTIGAFGSNVTLTGGFTGLEGDFYFGNSNVMVVGTCGGGTTTWNGTIWDNGTPTNTMNAVVNGTYNTTTASIDACSLTISGSQNLVISAGTYVKIEENITVNTGSTLNIQHEGSLVQVNDFATVTKNGTINVIKTTPVATGDSFSILGSPMSASTRGGVFADNNVLMKHDTSLFNLDPSVTAVNLGAEHFADTEGDNWIFMLASNPTAQVSPAEGYLVGPTTASVTSGFYELNYSEGTLNNGVYTKNLIFNDLGNGDSDENKNNSPNILSNPYASAIDAIQFIGNNLEIDAVYFWNHITAPVPDGDGTGGTYPGYRFENWDMGDISIHNATMGIEAPNDPGNIPTQFIPSGQGFGVKASAPGNAIFNNSLRVTGPNTGYRIANMDKIYITIKNETYNLYSSTGISFTSFTSNDYEVNSDTKRLATPISIYSVLEELELALQGRSVFTTDQIIPLGFRTMVEEEQTYTISLGELEGDNINAATVYLEDHLLHTVTNLSETDYTFTANESNQKDRFVIVFIEEQLGNSEVRLEAISIYPNPTSGTVTISSPLSTISNVEVYDIRGRVLMTTKVDNQLSYQIDMSSFNSAVYFVKINTEVGSIIKRVVRE